MKIPIINSKKIGIIVGAVAALALSYGAGRYSRPAKVVETSHQEASKSTDTDTKQKTVEQAKVDTHEQQDQHVHKHVVKTTTKKPDGTVQQTVVTDENNDSGEQQDTHAQTTSAEQQQTQQHTQEHTEQDHSKVTINFRPQWLISAYVGGIPSEVFAAAPKFMEGVSIEKQIIGPLYGGVWAMNIGSIHDPKLAGGVKASVLF